MFISVGELDDILLNQLEMVLLKYREAHPCNALCAAQGACEISTVPLRVESTFTGKLETFQYTKVSSVLSPLLSQNPNRLP